MQGSGPGLVDLFNIVPALIVAVTAWVGLSQWKREAKAKRAMELGEQVLAAAYEVKDAIDFMRAPWADGSEMQQITREENETEEAFVRRRTYAMPSLRYGQNKESFARLLALRYRAAALFGYEYRVCIEELTGLARKVMHAAYGAHQLASIKGAEPEERRVRREAYEATMGWVIEENDEFSLLTEAKLHEVEKRYRVIAANGALPEVGRWRKPWTFRKKKG